MQSASVKHVTGNGYVGGEDVGCNGLGEVVAFLC
jgi:hypothetical protein